MINRAVYVGAPTDIKNEDEVIVDSIKIASYHYNNRIKWHI